MAFLYFQSKFFFLTHWLLHEINTHDKSLGERFLCVLFNNQIDDIDLMMSLLWHTKASFVVPTKTLSSILSLYPRLGGPMKWHPCNSSLSVKLQQSSGTQWDLTITKNSVLLSYSSPFMDEDKEIVAEFWWPAQEYQRDYPGTKWVEFVFEKYIFPQPCGTSDFLKALFCLFLD